MTTSSRKFWDAMYEGRSTLEEVNSQPHRTAKNQTEERFLSLLSDVEGLEVLEVGCGTGKLAGYLAKRGAHVTATDISRNAIERTRERAEANQVTERITLRRIDALKLKELGATYDLVVGKFVLHHIEPFEEFVGVVYDLLKEEGKAVFMENNSRNPILHFARENLAGRFGIPKYGDFEEHPLEPREVEVLERRFGRARQDYPEFVFFRLLNTYLFRGADFLSPLFSLNKWIDRMLYRSIPSLRKYSYYQIVEASKR